MDDKSEYQNELRKRIEENSKVLELHLEVAGEAAPRLDPMRGIPHAELDDFVQLTLTHKRYVEGCTLLSLYNEAFPGDSQMEECQRFLEKRLHSFEDGMKGFYSNIVPIFNRLEQYARRIGYRPPL